MTTSRGSSGPRQASARPTARASGQHRSAGARLEAFAEEVTNLARANHRRPDLHWEQAGDLFKVHCPFPGPERDPHRCSGGPQVLLFWKVDQLTASCPKCLGLDHNDDDARADYTGSLLDAVGWTEEQAARPRRPVKVIRQHDYFDRDGKHFVQHVKFKPANGGAPGWFWSIATLDADGKVGRPRTLSKRYGYTSREFLAEHYQELEHFHHALRWYKEERLETLRDYDAVVITEGERDADTFNALAAAGGVTRYAATCLGYNKPKSLASHHLALVAGRRAVIIGDCDQAGQERAENWAHVLWDHVDSVKIIREQLKLPGTPDAKDLTDWVDARGGPSARVADELFKIISDVHVLYGRHQLTYQPAADLRGYSDEGLALSLGREWQDAARHVAPWGRWLFWDAKAGAWRVDETLIHMTRARAHLRQLGDKSGDDRLRQLLGSKATVADVVSLARSNAELVANVAQWDADPWLVATPGGTIHLQRGTVYKANPDDYLTKITAVGFDDGQGAPPLWGRFLVRVTGGDPELQLYLQRVAGYCLSGSIREHALFFLYGTGANGKSVFLNTLLGVWGEHALGIGSEMLMTSIAHRHETEIARLRGVRLAVASEIEAGQTWAEAKIKKLTGGDRLQGRFMRQDFFEFDPQFKLMIAGNNKPGLHGVDEAIRRRLHLIPFTVTIPPAERDADLGDKLRTEGPGILRWAAEGCLAWQKEGLRPPETVRSATQEYLTDEDSLGQWLAERTERKGGRTLLKALYEDWRTWANARGHAIRTDKWLSSELVKRGLHKSRSSGHGASFELSLKSTLQDLGYNAAVHRTIPTTP